MTKDLHIYLPDDLAARLNEVAASFSPRLSVSGMVVRIVLEWLKTAGAAAPRTYRKYANAEERKEAHRLQARESARRRAVERRSRPLGDTGVQRGPS